MAIVSDLLQLCRLCLVKDEVNVPIFEGESDDQQISLKISSCLPVTLSQDDRLPQKICSECCRKLDTLYEFRNSSVNAEKQLVTWLEELENQSKKTSEKMSIATESLSEKTIVKEEIDEVDENGALSNEAEDYILQQQVAYDKTDLLNDAADETGEPQPKRAKRAAALKALIHTQESEEDEEDIDEPEPITKAEEESEPSETDINESVDDTFAGGPSTSADDQPGPSGVGKSTEGPTAYPCFNLSKLKGDHHFESMDNARDVEKEEDGLSQTDYPWKCSKCRAEFSTRKHLREHRKTHKQEDYEQHTYSIDQKSEIYICDTCSAEFQDEEEVERHVSSHYSRYECKECDKLYDKPYDFSVHMQTHNKIGSFVCPLCEFATFRRTSMMSHINRLHLNKFIYQCAKCGKGFNDGLMYNEHENEHRGIKPFSCVVCTKTFTFSKYLLNHQMRYHTVTIDGVLRKNQCVTCLKIFAKDITFKNHIATKHKNEVKIENTERERTHLCDICAKGFFKKEKLNLHYRVHTGFKPYGCSYCEKSFTKKDYLVMHERVHNGEKPYSCEYCGKCFNQTAPLRIHIRGHTGERPYVCEICSNGFVSRSALNHHTKNYCRGRKDI